MLRNGRIDLANRVRHISQILGDGAGYDIESYTIEGNVKFIEVKTTKGDKTTAFFMTSNEISFSEINKKNYYLYRIFDYDDDTNSGKYFVLHDDLDEKVNFSPTQYRGSFVSDN